MLTIALLGHQRVSTGDVPIDALPTQRTLGLLAHLVLHAGSPVPRTHVAGRFWPDSTDAQARTNLRRELHHLRRALPDPDALLDADGATITWRADGPFTADVTEFLGAASEAESAELGDEFIEAAERAVHAYGGPLLPGHYDDWVLESRDELHRRCVALLDQLARTFRDQGDLARAIAHARRRVELEPLEEFGHQLLIELHALGGDRAAAVRSFHRCATLMERELGLDPSPSTVDLYRSLTAFDDGPDRHVESVDPPLVGREQELASLEGVLGSLGERPRIVAVGGEAGVGKSRLVEEFSRRSERTGVQVARARCYSSGVEAPLAPVVDWLRSPGLRESVGAVTGTSREEAAVLLPELDPARPPGPVGAPGDPWRRRRLLEALVRPVLDRTVPTLLVVDDLQWSDPETIEWLDLLVGQGTRAPLLVVATVRSEELDAEDDLSAVLLRWRAAGVLDEMELQTLTPEAVAELASCLVQGGLDEVRLERLVARTGGNPLFVTETLRGVPIGSSRSEAVLSSRLDRLGPAARELVALMACWGRAATVELLEAASGADHADVVDALDELWRRRVVRGGTGATYELAHDLISATAYRRLSPPQRALRHRRLAAALRTGATAGGATTAARLADQLERGGRPVEAAEQHRTAASSAAAVHAYSSSLRHHRAALRLLDEAGTGDTTHRAAVLVGVGLAERNAGEPHHELTLLEAAELARRLGDPVLAATAVMGVGQRGFWSASFSGDPRRVACATAVLDHFESSTGAPPALHARLLALVAMDLHFSERSREARELLDRAERLARSVDEPEALLDVLAARTLAGLGPDTTREMHHVARECVQLASGLDDPLRLSHEYRRLATNLRRVGRVDEARRAGDRAVAVAAGLDHGPTDYWLADHRVIDALQTGDPVAARRHRDEAAEIGGRIGFGDTTARALYATFVIHLLEGATADLATDLAPVIAQPGAAPPLRAGAAFALATDGQHDAASEALNDVVADLQRLAPTTAWLLVAALAARTAHVLSEPEPAATVLDQLSPYPSLVVLAGPAVFGTTDQALGLAAAAAGDRVRAAGHLADAADFERRAGMHGWRMFSELERVRLVTGASEPPAPELRDLVDEVALLADRTGNRAVRVEVDKVMTAS